ncbi:DUF4232 domain-containing protein [Streptomyces sp. RS10V-4]|uniref:DUF4232 domain-containing protein n=1 Tax=Streptomyces rhizoryzae TaxID=2932493 RepID=UPI002006CD7A|nr:DUF4232 domain-containing protein [Streptomyces rhizoryzae]MCK7626829.1 DUF4232 domain-containing protein [Streptomyces rhizoryzae]
MRSNTVRTATVRRRTLRVTAAALTAAAGLTLTACSGTDAGGTKAAGPAGATVAAAHPEGKDPEGAGSATAAQGAEPEAASGAKGAKAGTAGKQEGTPSAARGGKAGSGIQRCHTSGLRAAFATGEDAAPDPNAGGSTTTSIVLTNKGSRACVIGGFAGVDLKSENGGQVWSLVRSSARHGSITLGPGDSTDFTLNLALAQKDEAHPWMPAFVAVTPPNETTSLTLKWPWGALVDQSGATHPATFVNPIG